MNTARTIAVSDDVYKLLSDSKMVGESFSDVIRRGLRKPPLTELAGKRTLTSAEWEVVKRHLAEAHRQTVRELKRAI